MRIVAYILAFASFWSCTGKLSNEDRRALKEEMENRELRQIRDDDIVSRAMDIGRQYRDSTLLPEGIIREEFVGRPDNALKGELWDAYEAASESGIALEENIQRDYPDNLIYSYALTDSVLTLVVITVPKSIVIKSL